MYMYIYIYLFGGIPTPLKNMSSSHPTYDMENKSHVPNHQPDIAMETPHFQRGKPSNIYPWI
jgi:hypothetical protein